MQDDPEKEALKSEAKAWLAAADDRARDWQAAQRADPELDRERLAFVPEAQIQQEPQAMAGEDANISPTAPREDEPLTLETLREDGAVVLRRDIPADASPELLVAAFTAAEMVGDYARRLGHEDGVVKRADELQDQIAAQYFAHRSSADAEPSGRLSQAEELRGLIARGRGHTPHGEPSPADRPLDAEGVTMQTGSFPGKSDALTQTAPEIAPKEYDPEALGSRMMMDKDDLYLADLETAQTSLSDAQRGEAFLAGVDGLIKDSPPELAGRLEAFNEGLGETHPEVGDADHAAAIGRDIREGEGFMKWSHTPELVGTLLENGADRAQAASLAPVVSADFRASAHDLTMTPQNEREADVAAIIHGLEEATGLKETAERAAYAKGWQALGDQISSEPDPEKRGDLRDVREALSHDYAADLADKAATLLVVNGNQRGAEDMASHAETRRVIAAQLRGEGPENDPSRETDRAAPEVTAEGREAAGPTAREQFMQAALEAAGLGRTARVEFVTEGPARAADQESVDAIGEKKIHFSENRAEIGAFMGFGPEGTFLYTGQNQRPAREMNDGSVEAVAFTGPHRPGEVVEAASAPLSPATIHELDQYFAAAHGQIVERDSSREQEQQAAYIASDLSAKAQQAEIAASHGGAEIAAPEMGGEMSEARQALAAYTMERMAEADSRDAEAGRDDYSAAFRTFGTR